MKTIVYLLFLITSICYSQNKVNINSIINRHYKFNISNTNCNVQTVKRRVPIYRPPQKLQPVLYRVQDPSESAFIRNTITVGIIRIGDRSTLDLTPIVLKDIEHN